MGKTREQTTETDKKLTGVERWNIDRAKKASKIPFTPNYGNTIAGFTDPQKAAFNMANQASSAYGFEPAPDYVPPEGSTVGGIFGHSPGVHYDDMKEKSVGKGLQSYIDNFFIDPNGSSGGGRGGNRSLFNMLGNGNLLGGQGGETNAGDGNSQYGGGAGWSRDPYDDPISSGHEQYGTERSLGNRAVSAAGNAWSNSPAGRMVDIAGGGSGAGTSGGGGK